MRNLVTPLIVLLLSGAHAWEPAEHSMLTPWGEALAPENAWTEYPRPQLLRRADWKNLNGLWDYAVTSDRARHPEDWRGKILVPFALETPLSGVGRRLGPNEVIWYQTTFELEGPPSERLLLHFEGVDYKCMAWVNGIHVGDHIGGNLPFSFDVTEAVQPGVNTLKLRVIDGTDDPDLYQLRGKQKRDNSGIWYTPSSGIWATVWLEPAPQTYIERLRIDADMNGRLRARAFVAGDPGVFHLRARIEDDGETLRKETGLGPDVELSVKNPKLWSPESPHLYDLEFELVDDEGAVIDRVESYTGFRTTGKTADADGNWRFTLNGERIFHLGPLDQGWWPGSFLLPPADAAIVWEMEFLKEAGFNMIRKHKKVEPRRYYYHADRLGLLVWQDQPSGGTGGSEWPKWQQLRAHEPGYRPHNERRWASEADPLDIAWPDWAHEQFMAELKGMIDTLYNHPSVVVWTTFNERWGQHRSTEIGHWVKDYDPSRHLNLASGGNFFPVTDIADEHNYPDPYFPLGVPLFDDYIKVIGEFGGHGWAVEGHLWDESMRNWGYGGLPKTREEYIGRYRRTAEMMGEYRRKGVTAGVYTQTTDVEGELNGLITYDREVIKIPADELRAIHREAGLIE